MRVPLLVALLVALPARAWASDQDPPKALVVQQLEGDATSLPGGRNLVLTASDAKELRQVLVHQYELTPPPFAKKTAAERAAFAGEVAKKLETQSDYATERIVLVRMMTGGPPFGTLRHEIGKDPGKKKVVFFAQAPTNGPRGKAARCIWSFLAVRAGYEVTMEENERPAPPTRHETAAKQIASARDELQRTAIEQLQSDDLATAAWGAYAVAEFRLSGCAADVRKRLASLADRTGVEGPERRAAVAMLDALIETDATVPAHELAPFVDLGAPAIVLMARDPGANRASLLRAFEGASDWMCAERRACGNLLAQVRDPDFVLRLLRGPWQRWVQIVDPGATKDHRDLDSLDCLGVGENTKCDPMPVPTGFPPLVRHTLQTDARPGCRVVAPGPETVFLQRSWYRDEVYFSSRTGYRDLRIARAGWIEQMHGGAQLAAFRVIEGPVAIEWKDRAVLDAYAQQAAQAAELTWRALVRECVNLSLLTRDAAAEPMPAICVGFHDGRRDTTVPLPPSAEERRE